MTERISERIAGMVALALETEAQGDDVLWDVIMGMTPQKAPAAIVVLTMKGAVLDTVVHNQTVLDSPTVVDQEGVDMLIRAMVNGLRTERSKQLAGANGGGIHLPGQ
jgi:hypothetical protein